MVLTKLFNIFTITASMGSGLLNTPPKQNTEKPKINRSTNETYSYDSYWSYDANTELYYEDGTTSIKRYGKGIINNSYVNIEVVNVCYNATGEYATNILDMENVATIQTKPYAYEPDYPQKIASQMMYLFKVNAINNNINTTLTIAKSIFIRDLNSYGNPIKIYTDLIVTTQDLSRYFNTEINNVITMQNKYFYSPLWNQYIGFINGSGGYQTSRQIEKLENEDQYSRYVRLYNTWNIQLTKSKTNYIALFVQAQYTANNGDIPQTDRTYSAQMNKVNNKWGTTYTPFANESLVKFSGTNVILTDSIEVVNIPGVMFEVLGMPFTFISTAFNLTLFPGTAYEVNISTLFLSIIAVFVFVLLIRIVVSVMGGKG